MFELCRKIVAGPKKKLEWKDKELDLTYVTDRIIAMAFPASGLQSAYRNSIKDVSQYLHEKHDKNFLVINVSSRKYDYKFFNNNVLQYEWRDHLSPPLSTLFEIARQMYEYLKKNKNNVVAVHCNHGKGRTGTTIISFLLYTGFFQKFDQALSFYNKRRFVSLTYGVSQPCQKRYLNYFQILKERKGLSSKLISYKIKNIRQKGLGNEKYYMEIISIRKQQPKYRQIYFEDGIKKRYPNVPLIGDICIQIFADKWNGGQEIAIINCHTFFFDYSQNWVKVQESMKSQVEQHEKEMRQTSMLSSFSTAMNKQQKFSSKNIKVNGKHNDFEICIDFEWYCYCHLQAANNKDCPCQQERVVEEKYWRRIVENVEVSRKITKLQGCALLSSIEYLHQQQILKQQEEQKKKLQKQGASNLQKKNSIKYATEQKKNIKSSKQEENTEPSPITSSQEEKNSIEQSQSQNNYGFSNSYDNSNSNRTEDNFANQQFEYDMVIVNRNSTNSV